LGYRRLYPCFFGQGGLPEYLKSGNYTFNGFASFSLGWTETQNFLIKEGEAKEWALTVEDELGCSGQKQEAIICTKTPIELLDFSGLALENGNQISWATATETNSAYFILERSIGNASQFTPITKQAAKGKNFGAAYKFIDTQAPNGISYYRLLELTLIIKPVSLLQFLLPEPKQICHFCKILVIAPTKYKPGAKQVLNFTMPPEKYW
jgi:hypothetical protein